MKKEKIALMVATVLLVGSMVACGSDNSNKSNEITIDLSNSTSEKATGSGNIASKALDIPEGTYQLSMDSISSSNSTFKIIIDSSESDSRIECDDNVVEDFSVKVDEQNQTLAIVGDSSVFYDGIQCTITINVPIWAVTVAGSTEVEYMVPDMISEIKVEEAGSSSVVVQGACATAVFDVEGSCVLDASELTASNVELIASGSSDVDVYVENELTVEASGSSSIRYSGNPQTVNQDISGTSSVEKK
jgi:hypothetical protein